jgi:hypothetical protein
MESHLSVPTGERETISFFSLEKGKPSMAKLSALTDLQQISPLFRQKGQARQVQEHMI